MTKIELTRDN